MTFSPVNGVASGRGNPDFAVAGRAWLRQLISRAAERASRQDWRHGDDMAVAITTYLKGDCARTPYSVAMFERLVRKTLSDAGYPEIAAAVRIKSPVTRISLAECVTNPPVLNEHEFYDRVRVAIRDCYREGTDRLEFCDLATCIERLNSVEPTFPWYEKPCRLWKIVSFVRRELGRHKWTGSFQCLVHS